jgi:hypothetical protein
MFPLLIALLAIALFFAFTPPSTAQSGASRYSGAQFGGAGSHARTGGRKFQTLSNASRKKQFGKRKKSKDGTAMPSIQGIK